RPGEPADPPRSPAPYGNGPVGGPRPAPAGRVLLRVKQRPRPDAEDRPTAATDRSAEADPFEPATTSQPVTANQAAAAREPSTTGDPGSPGPEPSGRRIRGRVLAAGAVVVAAAVGSGVALSGGSAPAHPAAATPTPTATSPSPSLSSPSAAASPSAPATASQQAAALGALMTSSVAARTALHNAVTQVGGCTHLPGAVSQLQAVVNRRAGQYDRASALSTGALPGGAQVKSTLLAALGTSLTADRDYLSWARQQLTGGCTPTGQSSAYNAAFSASRRADAAKEAFVQVWNPVAARYGIARESPRNI
ncbi:MAG TPA: hypothetical protein VGD83_29275, partial [Streptosporangiaceae bacterium]